MHKLVSNLGYIKQLHALLYLLGGGGGGHLSVYDNLACTFNVVTYFRYIIQGVPSQVCRIGLYRSSQKQISVSGLADICYIN